MICIKMCNVPRLSRGALYLCIQEMIPIIHMSVIIRMEEFAMSLNKYLLSFLLCGAFFPLFAEEKANTSSRQFFQKSGNQALANHEKIPQKSKRDLRFFICGLFTHIIEDIPFDSSWNIYWSNQANNFFNSIIPEEIKKYQSKISFAGEFLRFLRPRIIGTKYNFFNLCIYTLSPDVVTCQYKPNLKVKNIRYINNDPDFPVREYLVRLNSYVKKDLNGRFVTHTRQQYFYVGGTILLNGNMRIAYSEILANEGLPLKNRTPILENIPKKILNEFQEWTKTQQEKYKNLPECHNRKLCSQEMI